MCLLRSQVRAKLTANLPAQVVIIFCDIFTWIYLQFKVTEINFVYVPSKSEINMDSLENF